MAGRERVALPAEALARIARATGSLLDPKALYAVLYEQTARLVETDAFYLALYDPDSELLHFVAHHDQGRDLPAATHSLGDGPTSWVVRERVPLVVNAPGEGPAPAGETFGSEARSGAAIHVPMLLGDRLLGVISTQSYRAGAYTPDDLRIMETIATHAAIALETARVSRATHRAEATVRDTLAASELLLDLTRDLAGVETVDAAVQRGLAAAMELLGVDGAFLAWKVDHRPATVITLGVAGAEMRHHQTGDRWSGESTIAELLGGASSHGELETESAVASGAETSRTNYTVAIRAGSTPVGTLTVSAPSEGWRQPTEQQRRVLCAIGDQTAAAVLAMRGRAELRRRLQQIEALGRVAHDLARVGDLERTMRRLAEEGMRVFGAQRAGVYFLRAGLGIVGSPVTIGLSPEYVRQVVTHAKGLHVIERILESRPVFLADAREMRNAPMAGAVEREGIVSQAALPLNFMGDVIGALVFYHNERRNYTEDERRLALAFADQAALAIGKSRLLEQVGRAKEEWERAFDATAGLAILDGTGRVLRANRAAAEVAGVAVTELPGLDLDSRLVPLEGGGEAGLTALVRAGRTRSLLARSARGRIVAVSGGRLESGGWLVSLDDVTDELLAEEALKRSETKFRTLFDSAPVSMFTLDSDRAFQSLNRAARDLLGREPAEGVRLEDVVVPSDRDYAIRQLAMGPEGSGRDFILHFSRPDGSIRNAAILWVPLAGDVAGIRLVIARDLTYEMSLRERLMQSEKMAALGQLVSGVAHELNNPLAGIMALAQALMPEAGTDEGVRRVLEGIRGEAGRAARIVNDLLTFSRQRPLVLTDLDLNGLVRDVMDSSREPGVGGSWELDLAPDLPLIQADGEQVRQVLVNLVQNAEYSMRGQEAGIGRVCTAHDGDIVRCEVRDVGPGVPPELLGRILEPFFTTKPAGDGTGLGLAIVHGIVRAHGGQIHVRNRPEGGASFTFELPRRITAEPRAHHV